jgi:hypothetical protein
VRNLSAPIINRAISKGASIVRTFYSQQPLKDTLVDRARRHRELDEIVHSGYGTMEVTTRQVKFDGCAVACLATPVIERREFDPSLVAELSAHSTRDVELTVAGSGQLHASFEASLLYGKLRREFNLPYTLLTLAESVFESAGDFTEGNLDWPRDFAEAIPVAAKVTEQKVAEWILEQHPAILIRAANYHRSGRSTLAFRAGRMLQRKALEPSIDLEPLPWREHRDTVLEFVGNL